MNLLNSKYFLLISGILLAVIGLATYWKVLPLSFLADDYIWLLEATKTDAGDLLTYYTESDGFFYRPTTKLYFWIMLSVFGQNAFVFHFSNLLIHIICTIAVLIVVRRILERYKHQNKNLMSLLVAGAFLLNPVHLEPVAWVSGVTELIPAMCLFLAMIVTTYRVGAFGKILGSAIVVVLYWVAVGAHEYAILFPLIILFWQIFLDAANGLVGAMMRVLRKEKLMYGLLLLVGLIYLYLRYLANSHWQGGDYSYDLLMLPLNFFGNAISYILLAVIGSDFYPIYLNVRMKLREQMLVVSLLAMLAMIAMWKMRNLCFALLRRKDLIALVAIYIFALGAFLPLGNITERYVYFVSFLPYLLLILLTESLIKRSSSWSKVLLAALAVALIAQTSYLLLGSEQQGEYLWLLLWLGLLSVNFVLIYRFVSVNGVPKRAWLMTLIVSVSWGVSTYAYIVRDWHVASAEVNAFVGYFDYACAEYNDGDSVAVRVKAKVRTAWIFPVGQEQSIELVCGKKISIIRI